MTSTDLRFDPATHTTTAPDGRDVPHVTRILAATGLSTDFEELARGSRLQRDRIAFASARGTAVHADCHAFDDSDLDWSDVDVRIVPFVRAWERFRNDKKLVPIAHARERLIFHDGLWYAGIIDGVFVEGAGRRILVDIKTGDPEDAAAHLQTAAYEAAWNRERPTERIDARWAVRLVPGLRVPYRIIDYSARPDGRLDAGKWQAALCVFNEQPERRQRVA